MDQRATRSAVCTSSAPSLAAALLDELFEHPCGLCSCYSPTFRKSKNLLRDPVQKNQAPPPPTTPSIVDAGPKEKRAIHQGEQQKGATPAHRSQPKNEIRREISGGPEHPQQRT